MVELQDSGADRLLEYGSDFTEKTLTWPEIWNEMSPRYYTYNMHGMQRGYNRNDYANEQMDAISTRTLGTVRERRSAARHM